MAVFLLLRFAPVTDWKDKVALITGGSAGLGRALAARLAHRGARVVIVARGAEPLQATAAALRQAGGDVEPIVADITKQADVDRLFQEVHQRYGRLDLLINCAGRSSRGEILQTTPEQFQELWELNFLALVRCTRAAAPELLRTQGHVVNIGSLAAKSASRFLGAYPASKFPVAAYSQQLRLELEPYGLHVLLVCPGPIAREEPGDRYADQSAGLPESARRPGGGVKVKAIDPEWLSERILEACQSRQPELIVPAKARLLFTLSQISPRLGDWLVRKMTK